MAGIPSSSRPGPSPQPIKPYLNRVFDGPAGRILCVADIRGQHSYLNQLAKESGARAIIHTGDFGFFENSSLDRINDRTLRHLLLYSPLIPAEQRESFVPKDLSTEDLRVKVRRSPTPLLSEFPLLLTGQLKLSVPVYTVSGACEDVAVLEKFRLGTYEIDNLHVIDEATSRTLEIGGIKLRLFGLGGAFVPHKLFDNGDGQGTIAGGQGTVWTTALQIGELVDTAQRSFDQSETRLLVTHASPGKEGLLAQLALLLKADLTISAALHFRYASSWNEFSVAENLETYKKKLESGRGGFEKVWDTVKAQVEKAVDPEQKLLLEKAHAVSRVGGTPSGEDLAWKNTWNWNLCDAAFGHLVLDIKEGRVSAELKSQGFNYAYRRAPPSTASASTPAMQGQALPSSAPSPAPGASPAPPTSLPLRPASSQPGARAPNGVASPAPLLNGVNGAGDLATGGPSAVASPRSTAGDINATPGDKPHKKKLSNAEKRERKAEKERSASVANESEAGLGPISHPGSPAPSAAKPPHKKNASRGTASPAPSPSPAPVDSDAATSPAIGNESSTGAKSPISGPGRRPRNPWTLFVNRLPIPVSEAEIRDVFGEGKGSISAVKLAFLGNGPTRQQKPHAYVEFRDESAMQAALNNNAGRVKDQPIRVVIAENRDDPNVTSDGGPSDRPGSSGFRGGSQGRGSFRGGRGGGGRGGLFGQEIRRSLGQGGQGMRKPSDGSTTNDLRPNGNA